MRVPEHWSQVRATVPRLEGTTPQHVANLLRRELLMMPALFPEDDLQIITLGNAMNLGSDALEIVIRSLGPALVEVEIEASSEDKTLAPELAARAVGALRKHWPDAVIDGEPEPACKMAHDERATTSGLPADKEALLRELAANDSLSWDDIGKQLGYDADTTRKKAYKLGLPKRKVGRKSGS